MNILISVGSIFDKNVEQHAKPVHIQETFLKIKKNDFLKFSHKVNGWCNIHLKPKCFS